MLKEIYIENLAVIEKASIEFTHSFNVFTGETGAGKSILINGINAILGQRMSRDIVRTGADKAMVSAVFDKLGADTCKALSEYGISTDDGELIITREIRSDGGSSARINSRPISITAMRDIGNTLVNIHGQHDNQILLSPEKHIKILDDFSNAQPLIDDYRDSFRRLQAIAKEINTLKVAANQKAFRINQLQEIITEIERLDLKENEDTDIKNELEISKNVVVLSEGIYKAISILDGNDDADGAYNLIQQAGISVGEYSDIMPDLDPLSERLNSAFIELEDISQELASILDKLDVDPKRYDYLNERSTVIRRICKKYGPELSDVFKCLEDSKNELDNLLGTEQSLSELEKEKNSLLAEVTLKAKNLSDFRKKSGKKFVSQVTEELSFLNMPDVTLVVQQIAGKLTVNGLDNIEFLISANPGEEPRPIAKIASGGELSRIMLALKNVLAEKDSIDTLIFDEIDTGVSGRAALKIGMKLSQISKYRQVICVTHLAQLAVMADNHLLIEKNVVGERTSTSVTPLDFAGRKHEIARIMSGDAVDELSLANAEEMIKKYTSI